ncbi:helix-turn-helix domain-containing protein [Paenibacillus baimaensis]|uniref:helix-turn-helix domain-containing protein n=1 Tax=Paenibacillus baimaensis TaxID=2982185 RepID=UPI0021CF5587|nr:helix-turn-helix domain-containing protein [Paenibacillus sp. WQ 127069]
MNQNDWLKRAMERKQSGYIHQYYELEKLIKLSLEKRDINLMRVVMNKYKISPPPDRMSKQEAIFNDRANAIRIIDTAIRISINCNVNSEQAFSLGEVIIADISRVTDRIKLIDYLDNAIQLFIRIIKEAENHAYSLHVERCIRYIQQHIFDELKVKNIAVQQQISPDYLSNLFYSDTGINLSTFIHKQKIKEAQLLFSYCPSYSINDVATMLSFKHVSHFSTLFKKYTGLTPREYKIQINSASFENRGAVR